MQLERNHRLVRNRPVLDSGPSLPQVSSGRIIILLLVRNLLQSQLQTLVLRRSMTTDHRLRISDNVVKFLANISNMVKKNLTVPNLKRL